MGTLALLHSGLRFFGLQMAAEDSHLGSGNPFGFDGLAHMGIADFQELWDVGRAKFNRTVNPVGGGVRLQEEPGSNPQKGCRQIARQLDTPESRIVVLDDRAIEPNARTIDVLTSLDVFEVHGLFDDALPKLDVLLGIRIPDMKRLSGQSG